ARYYEAVYADLKDARPRAATRYQAMAGAGDDPRGPLLVSNAYVKMDQQQQAAQVTREGLRRYPGNVPLTERLIVCDLLTGTAKEAEQLCRDWMRRDPASSRPRWFLGRVQLTLQNQAGALQLFERAARAEPNNAEYQF